MKRLRPIMVLRSVAEPAVVRVEIGKGVGTEEIRQQMMRDISEAIEKNNRQLARAGEERMAYRIELV